MTSPNLSSYRVESKGCKAALMLLNKFDKDTPRVLLCDNMSAIQSLNKLRNHLPHVNQSDYDVLLEIKELIQPTIRFQHVKGHQGTELSDEFDLQANLNILMDSRAKRIQQVVQHTPDWTHQNKYQILYNNEIINGKIIKSLRQEIGSTRLRLHYKNKFKENYDNILWDSFTFTCQNYNPKKGVLKMIHNIAPTQITLHKRHLSHDTLCPVCQEAEETIMHIIKCNDSNGILQQQFCTLLNKKLKTKTDTHQTIINDMYELIIDKPTGSLQSLQWEIQQHLGWDCSIRGYLSTEWLEIPRLMNLEKPEVETVGWIIITLWKTWNEAWKA
jgi:hypothetical protein